jgi:hypothetical protein
VAILICPTSSRLSTDDANVDVIAVVAVYSIRAFNCKCKEARMGRPERDAIAATTRDGGCV